MAICAHISIPTGVSTILTDNNFGKDVAKWAYWEETAETVRRAEGADPHRWAEDRAERGAAEERVPRGQDPRVQDRQSRRDPQAADRARR